MCLVLLSFVSEFKQIKPISRDCTIAGKKMKHLHDFDVPQQEVSQLLLALGIHLDTSLAPAFVLVATDLLLASELARTLPVEADFISAITRLQSFSQELPEPVLLTAQKVYQQLLAAADEPEKSRLRMLGDYLQI